MPCASNGMLAEPQVIEVTLLVPHANDGALATALVDVAGRDEETAALLTARIRTDHRLRLHR